MSKERLVYVTTVDHRHGTNIYVNKTRKGAEEELLGYVTENWESEMPKDQPIQASGNRVRDYFYAIEEEFYGIEFLEVGD